MAATGNFWEHQATTGWKHSKGSRLPKQKGITHTRIPRGNVAAIDAEREKGAELSQTGDAFDPLHLHIVGRPGAYRSGGEGTTISHVDGKVVGVAIGGVEETAPGRTSCFLYLVYADGQLLEGSQWKASS